MRVIVVGGGICGLSTALALHAVGIEARVYEAVPKLGAVGVGINIQPNAVRELIELGLGDELARNAIATAELAFYSKHGQRIWSEPRGLAAGYRWPQYSIHRGTLLMILYEAVRSRIGDENIFLGHSLDSFSQDAQGVNAQFVDRASGERLEPVRGDVLIGADGIHSTVRRHYYPEDEVRFGGQLMWRAAVEWSPFLTGRSMIIAGHRDQKVVAYPMLALPGGKVDMNWIAELGRPGGAPPREDWNRRVDKSVFLEHFRGWKFDWLDVPAMIEATDVTYEFPKIDRNPVDRWTHGRITLAGDAAHPMHPVGSQAGSQAIVDGRVLAYHLATCSDPMQALQRFQDERLPAMRDITLGNRTLGPEIVMQVVEERAPGGFSNLDDILPPAELASRAAEFKEKAGFAVDALNRRASYSVH
jgi:2-polyprenyl-6-methoxyphenol hydroxylase-like FAD-dependent oxidoreductase